MVKYIMASEAARLLTEMRRAKNPNAEPVAASTVRQKIRHGIIPAQKVGRYYWIQVDALKKVEIPSRGRPRRKK
jgi:hypothetical protein